MLPSMLRCGQRAVGTGALRADGSHRPGRHGRGLARRAPGPGGLRGGQGADRRPGHGAPVPRGLPERGPGDGRTGPPGHRPALRLRPGPPGPRPAAGAEARKSLPGDGAGGGRVPVPPPTGAALAGPPGRAVHPARGPGPRPRPGRRPPGSEAREPDARPGRCAGRREDLGLRPGPRDGGGAGRRHGPPQDPGHPGLHGTRAVPGQLAGLRPLDGPVRPGVRRLGPGRGLAALRTPGGPAGLPPGPREAAPADLPAAATLPRGLRTLAAETAGQAPAQPLPTRSRRPPGVGRAGARGGGLEDPGGPAGADERGRERDRHDHRDRDPGVGDRGRGARRRPLRGAHAPGARGLAQHRRRSAAHPGRRRSPALRPAGAAGKTCETRCGVSCAWSTPTAGARSWS